MTRINLVDPSELHRSHLVAEYREIVRVFALAHKNQYEMHKKKLPEKYTLGTGNVNFFLDKLKFISERYDSLCKEMLNRGYTGNRVPREDLHQGVGKSIFLDYKPTEEALAINRQRISDRMPKN